MATKKSKSSKQTIILNPFEHAKNVEGYDRFCIAWDEYYKLYLIVKQKVDGTKDLLSEKKNPQWKQWITNVNEEYTMILPELDDSWKAMKDVIYDEWKKTECRFFYTKSSNKVESYETCESLLGSRTYGLRKTDKFQGSNFDPNGFYTKILTARLFPGVRKYRPKPDKLVRKPKGEKIIKLTIKKNKKEVYWEDNLLSTIKDKDFYIILKLAKSPGEPVENDKLYKYIKSNTNEGVLLNQRISKIRKTFPSPYNDIKSPQCILPDAKKNKGFRCLNLTKIQVFIS